MSSVMQEFTKGLWKDLPPFRLVLGLCPTLAVTNSANNGLGMGAAVIFVLVLSNMIISMVRGIIPKKVRIACFIVIAASLVVAVELLMQAYAYPLYQQLGIFVPLIVVNCIILARAEAFAAKNGVAASVADGLGIGLGYTISLTFLGSLREILGNGTWFGNPVMWDGFQPFTIMVQAPGAFICLGLILAGMNVINVWQSRRKGGQMVETSSCGGCKACSMIQQRQEQEPAGFRKDARRDIFQLFISAIFVNNIVLAQYLGNCPYLGCSKEKGVALGMGGAVIFVIIVATACTWLMQRYVLEPFGLGYLQTIVFIVVIASLVQFVEMFLKKMVPPLYAALGIFLPLITTNCAVMGVAILVQREEYDLLTSVLYGAASAVGFTLALLLMAGIRERLDTCRLPKAMAGTPIALIMAGLMSLAFMGFKGMAQ